MIQRSYAGILSYMFAILFLLSVCINGMLILRLIRRIHLTLPFSFIIGSFATVTPIFLITSYVTRNLLVTLLVYAVGIVILYAIWLWKKIPFQIPAEIDAYLVFSPLILFGWYVFSKAFSYDMRTQSLLISSNTYMDFGAHVAIIRSFSKGINFPATLPFFARSGGAYYFLTDFYAGVLEYLGMRIDIALNTISTIVFASIGTALYILVYRIWKSKLLGWVAILIFFSSNTFEWVQFISQHSNPFTWVGSAYHMSRYIDELAVFWNLNSYVNQRQLLFGIASFCWFLFRHVGANNRNLQVELLVDGIVLGFLSYWHMHVFLATCLFVVLCSKRPFQLLGVALLTASPQLLSIVLHSSTHIVFSPGFIVSPLSISSWILFWVTSTSILIPLSLFGMAISGKRFRTLIVFTVVLFLIPNIFHISSRNVFDDHKFFIIWKLCMTLFAVFAFSTLRTTRWVVVGVLFLSISGIINFFVLKNDILVQIPDYIHSPLLRKVSQSINKDDIVLTNGEIYDPANIAGLKTLTGRVQYSYVYGGNPDPVLRLQSEVLSGGGSSQSTNGVSHILCYTNPTVPNIKPCNADALTKRYRLVYTDGLGSAWQVH